MILTKYKNHRKSRKQLRQRRGTRRLIDLKAITEYSIETYGHGEIVFLSLRPSNLSVLSPESLTARINALMNVTKGVADINMLCLNSRESFEENKRYLRERIEQEENEAVQSQLRQDIAFLDQAQTSMATAREFFIALQLQTDNRREILPYLHRVEKTIREQGFTVRRAESEDIKRILAVYFAQNVTSDRLEDVDGERFVKP